MSPVTKVSDDGLVATLHLPRESGRRPAVIVLSGSEGGVANANLFGAPLAAAGFVTMSLAYFAMDGLPRDLSRIPLEYFKKASTGCACIRPSMPIEWLYSGCHAAARRRWLLGPRVLC